jgi:cytochrome c
VQAPRRPRLRSAAEGRALRRARMAGLALGVLTGLAGCAAEEVPAHLRVLDGDPDAGKRAIAKFGCGACHTIPGVRDADGMVGPPLIAFSRRGYIAGQLPNRPAALTRWIMDPPAVEPGTAMPNMGVSEQEARDMASYLYTLD